jgi:hypothetical protein
MIVINELLLDEFRGPGRCFLCNKKCRIREPEHWYCRGSGGGARLDISINLLAVGSTRHYQCQCHTLVHQGNISKLTVLEVIAVREQLEPEFIQETIWHLLRLPKGTSREQLIDLGLWWFLSPGSIWKGMNT